jgi:hypothetical protein
MFEDVQITGAFQVSGDTAISSSRTRTAQRCATRSSINRRSVIFGQLAAPFLIIPRLRKNVRLSSCATRDWCEDKAVNGKS